MLIANQVELLPFPEKMHVPQNNRDIFSWYNFRVEVADEEFEKLLGEAIDAIPPPFSDHLQNVAFILEGDPTPEQRLKLNLYPNETLFGLYEGIPLPQRGGNLKILPDKITVFKNPLMSVSRSRAELIDKIHHTVWHEVAHYYGLDHRRIHELEGQIRHSSGK